MINFDDVTKEKISQIYDDPYGMLITGGSGSGKTNLLFNLIIHQPDIDKIYIARDPYKAKYQLLINKRECAGLKHLSNSKAFLEYSSGMNSI